VKKDEMKIIDISGFGHSGKTAVTELLRELDNTHVHHSSFEFGLLRLPDGLIDLKRNIIDNWSPIKSDLALKRFTRICFALNSNYNEQLGVDFLQATNKFIDSLVFDKLSVDWYDSLYFSDRSPFRDVLKKVLIKTKLLSFIRIAKKKYPLGKHTPRDTVHLINQTKLILNSQKYLREILWNKQSSNKTIVTNNAFDPYYPTENFLFFEDPFCIIVDRDPRDIYLSMVNPGGLFIPEFEKNNPIFSFEYLEGLKKDFLGISNIDIFIWRQKQIRQNVKFNTDNDRVIRINYEDLIYNYSETISSLFKKLKIDPATHVYKLEHFNPEISKENVGLWKNNQEMKEIMKIESELGDYLYE
jgi:hypothetical protein